MSAAEQDRSSLSDLVVMGEDDRSGGLAQLVRAGVSYAPGPGFDSLIRHSPERTADLGALIVAAGPTDLGAWSHPAVASRWQRSVHSGVTCVR
jgi:hypothetical protein